ncbi:MAG: DUF2029 domain-containing protein [Proteobacteria bacterium]|nr:DUF2029 domain-containing protein [Pseudomonadota bacterium]
MVTRRTLSILCLGIMGLPIYGLNFRLYEILQKRGLVGPETGTFTLFLYQYVPLAILYLVGIVILFKHDRENKVNSQVLYVILLFGLIYRIFLLPSQPVLSSDMYRYLWDGRVQAHGTNPYRYPPNDEALKDLRDNTVYPHINRKGSRTIYPAGAQAIFYLLHRLGVRHVTPFKAFTVLCDMGSILLLVVILKNLGLKRERVLVYAWNPLVIYEIGNNGHLDAFVVLFVLLAIFFLVTERPNATVSSLAVATSLKLYPLIILPALLRQKKVQKVFLFGAIVLLFYLPYFSVGGKVLGFLPEYLTNPHETFNLGLKSYLLAIPSFLGHWMVTIAFAIALVVAAAVVWIKKKEDAFDGIRFAYFLAGLQIVLVSASFHPWYLIWIIPFLSFYPSPAWLYFSLMVPFSYLKYQSPDGILPEWVRHMEYIPFFLLLAVEYFMFRKSFRSFFPLRLPGEEGHKTTMSA